MNNLVESTKKTMSEARSTGLAVDVPLLTAGVSTQRSLVMQSRLHKIDVPNDRTLSIKVDSLGTTGDVQIFCIERCNTFAQPL